MTEILHPQPEILVAFRQNQRYVARLTSYSRSQHAAHLAITPEATYLITGGLGALGLHFARWLVQQGARYLVLTGRQGITTQTQQEAVATLKAQGAHLEIAPTDVSNAVEVTQLFERIARTLPPLKGIIHAAGVVDDGLLDQQHWSSFERVMAAKVAGTWNLHRMTQHLDPEFFVCFSSIASLLGATGQGNYAAANAFIDALAAHRRASGRPAVSINWGPWENSGMTARLSEAARTHISSQGLSMLPVEQGLRAFSLLRVSAPPQVGVFHIDWQHAHHAPLPASQRRFLSEFLRDKRPQASSEQAGEEKAPWSQQILNMPEEQRKGMLTRHLQTLIAHVLGLTTSQLPNVHQGFIDMGMDSLMAIDFKNQVERDMGIALPATLAFEFPTIADLVNYLLGELPESLPDPSPPSSDKPEKGEADLDTLSEEELARLLSQELAQVREGDDA